MKKLSIRKWKRISCTNDNEINLKSIVNVNIMFEELKLYIKNELNELQAS